MRQDEAFIRVSEINKAGVTTIMVEQNARRCLQICDRGYVLDQGRDAYTGTGRELLNDPKVIGLYLGTLGRTTSSSIARGTRSQTPRRPPAGRFRVPKHPRAAARPERHRRGPAGRTHEERGPGFAAATVPSARFS